MDASPWLTVKQAAARVQCGRETIYHAIADGKLKAVRLGARRQWRVHVDWLDAWLDAAATVVNPAAPGEPHAFTRR